MEKGTFLRISMFLITILMVRRNKRCFLKGYLYILAWWMEKREERTKLLSCTHLGSRYWILFLIFKLWGKRKTPEQCFVNLMSEYLRKSQLTSSLFGRVWWIMNPAGDSPAPTKGGSSSHSQYLRNQCAALQLMSAWDNLNGQRKERFHRQIPVVMQNPGEIRRKVCTDSNCFYWWRNFRREKEQYKNSYRRQVSMRNSPTQTMPIQWNPFKKKKAKWSFFPKEESKSDNRNAFSHYQNCLCLRAALESPCEVIWTGSLCWHIPTGKCFPRAAKKNF